MTDDANDKQPQPRRRRPAPESAASPAGAADDESLAALERLQSLTSATAASPSTGASPVMSPPPASPTARRLAGPAPRTSPPRPAAAPRAGRMVARIAAPVVFLVAVVVLLSIISQSGVIGGKAEPVVTPTPAVTKTKNGGTTKPTGYKVYVVKSGDTLSGIAVKFDTSTSEIEALNPKLSSSTLVVGARIKVPKPVP
jgi:LysM repeat protein